MWLSVCVYDVCVCALAVQSPIKVFEEPAAELATMLLSETMRQKSVCISDLFATKPNVYCCLSEYA